MVEGSNNRVIVVMPKVNVGACITTTLLVSFKEEGKNSSRRQASIRLSFDVDNKYITLLHGLDLVKVELNFLGCEIMYKLEIIIRGNMVITIFASMCQFLLT